MSGMLKNDWRTLLLATRAPGWSILVRLLVGLVVFFLEGLQKLIFPDILGAGLFANIGIPYPELMSPFVGLVETIFLRKGPPPDNGLEVMYHSVTLGQRMLGHDEPIRVRQGERVLFRLLNASATMDVSLALPGHRFTVIALDGNPVPTPVTVDVLKLDVAERADVIVEMNNPGVWAFGSTDDEDRAMGMGVVVEYENCRGEPQWISPAQIAWDYTAFGRTTPAAAPDETIRLTFEKVPGGRGGYNRWTINGKSWPDTNPLFTVQEGKRYRLIMNNNSGDTHPVHTHRHTFEVTKVGNTSISGLMKDTLSMPRFTTAEIDFLADDPGATFFHCHHQDHMDEGFAGLITYS